MKSSQLQILGSSLTEILYQVPERNKNVAEMPSLFSEREIPNAGKSRIFFFFENLTKKKKVNYLNSASKNASAEQGEFGMLFRLHH